MTQTIGFTTQNPDFSQKIQVLQSKTNIFLEINSFALPMAAMGGGGRGDGGTGEEAGAQGGLRCFGGTFAMVWKSFGKVLGSFIYIQKLPIDRHCGRYVRY